MNTVEKGNQLKDEYHRYTGRKITFIIGCIVAAFVALGVSLCIGASDIGFFDVYRILFDHMMGKTYEIGTPEFIDDYIVCDSRLPRAVFALVAGAGLAVGGAVMQSVMKNALADPYTTGISSGACFGVAVSIVLGIGITNGGTGIGDTGTILNTFLFALIPMAFITTIAPRSNTSPATLILAGVAISYIFNALSTVLLITTDAETLSIVYRWQVGSLTDITWNSLPLMSGINIAGIVIVLFLSKKLNILALGDDNAKSLGLNVNNMRIICLMIVSFMVASVVSYAGIIAFIGLISAHIIRRVIDSDNRFVIPAAAAFGALFLLCSDIIARYLSPTDSIPVGVILSFVGAPIFLALIILQKKGMW